MRMSQLNSSRSTNPCDGVCVSNRRLEPWMRGYEEKFVEEALAQVEELKGEPFGQQFLHCIG